MPDDIDAAMEELADGFAVERDPDSGKFRNATLTPDRARLMAALGRAKGNKSKDADEIAETLIAALNGEPDTAKAAQSVLLTALAAVIARGGAAAVSAIRDAATALSIAWSYQRVPQSGQPCSRCGRLDTPPAMVQLNAEASLELYGLNVVDVLIRSELLRPQDETKAILAMRSITGTSVAPLP